MLNLRTITEILISGVLVMFIVGPISRDLANRVAK